jgi:hypothetical protein
MILPSITEPGVEMENATKITCTRCGGSGRFSFNLVRGTVCFGCEGVGHKVVDAKKHAAAQARKAKRLETQQANMAERIAKANAAYDDRRAKYENDPRIGPKTRARCEQFEAVAGEIYKGLHDFDTGAVKVHSSWFQRIAD